jgi:ankyrin repeat protein
MKACQGGHTEIVSLLLSSGASINSVDVDVSIVVSIY